jgi:opacity protein-like surface antigen
MKRLVLGFVFLISAALCIPGTASAQGTGGVHFGLSGGADFPVSDQKDVYKTGWNGTVLIPINFGTAPVGIRIDGSYHELKTQTDLQAFFLGDGRTRIISATADVVIGPRNTAVEPYFIGGVGGYDLRFRGQDITTGNAFSQSTTRFGWNAGVGIAFPLGDTGSSSRFFIEGRYTSVTVDADRFSNSIHRGGSRFTFVPVNAGFIF